MSEAPAHLQARIDQMIAGIPRDELERVKAWVHESRLLARDLECGTDVLHTEDEEFDFDAADRTGYSKILDFCGEIDAVGEHVHDRVEF